MAGPDPRNAKKNVCSKRSRQLQPFIFSFAFSDLFQDKLKIIKTAAGSGKSKTSGNEYICKIYVHMHLAKRNQRDATKIKISVESDVKIVSLRKNDLASQQKKPNGRR